MSVGSVVVLVTGRMSASAEAVIAERGRDTYRRRYDSRDRHRYSPEYGRGRSRSGSRDEDARQDIREGRCFFCRQRGHIKARCPERQGGVGGGYRDSRDNRFGGDRRRDYRGGYGRDDSHRQYSRSRSPPRRTRSPPRRSRSPPMRRSRSPVRRSHSPPRKSHRDYDRSPPRDRSSPQ